MSKFIINNKLYLKKPKITIQIGDHYSNIKTDNEGILKKLIRDFQFLSRSFWFLKAKLGFVSPKIRYGSMTAFISNKGRFQTGLFEEVAAKV